MARIDDRGRLKVPVAFMEELEEVCKGQFWITSPDGQYAWIYPMPEWRKIEEKLANDPSARRLRRKYLDRTNYFGQVVDWDKQGRVLIPSPLREKAEIKGDVAVLGHLTFLTVRNNERLVSEIDTDPITPEELDALGV